MVGTRSWGRNVWLGLTLTSRVEGRWSPIGALVTQQGQVHPETNNVCIIFRVSLCEILQTPARSAEKTEIEPRELANQGFPCSHSNTNFYLLLELVRTDHEHNLVWTEVGFNGILETQSSIDNNCDLDGSRLQYKTVNNVWTQTFGTADCSASPGENLEWMCSIY